MFIINKYNMLLRLIFLIIIIIYHKQIYNFLSKNNLTSFKDIKKKIQKVEKSIERSEIDTSLLQLKKLNKKIYKEVVLRLHNIDVIYKNIVKNNNISLRNEYNNIKDERKKILNSISSIVVSEGHNKPYTKILNVVDKYILLKIKNLDEMRENSEYNSEWFEDSEYIKSGFNMEAFDPQMNFNYDIF